MRCSSASCLVLALLAGCGSDSTISERPRVAVSIFPLYDLARRVAGDRMDVVLLLPPGRSEHGFEPTPQEMRRVSGARLAIVVGLSMDPWAERIVRSAAGGDVDIVRLGPELDPRRMTAPEVGVDVLEHAHRHQHEDADDDEDDHDDHAHDDHAHDHHAHGAVDPHVWLDPVRMQEAVDLIVEAFVRVDAAGADGYRERGAALRAELERLHTELEQRSRRWQRRTIVTFHGSFGYFAERYGLRIAAVIEPFPGREPTPRYMQEVIGAIRASGAAALFSEPQLDPRPARVIAQQARVPLHQLDPVGGTSGVDSYERLLRHDADVLDRALGAR